MESPFRATADARSRARSAGHDRPTVSYHKRRRQALLRRIRARLVVDAFHHHGQQTTEMGRMIFMAGYRARFGDRVFDRRTDTTIGSIARSVFDEPKSMTSSGARRRGCPVRRRPAPARQVRLRVRQGKRREGAKAVREAPCHCGVFVVRQARGFHASARRSKCGEAGVTERICIRIPAASISSNRFRSSSSVARHRARDGPRCGVSKPDEKIEISFAPQMSMHVYSHGRPP